MKLRMIVAIGLLGGGLATAALAEAGQRNPEAAGRGSGSSSSGGSSSGGSSSGGDGFAVPRSDSGSVSRGSGSSSEAPSARSPRSGSRDGATGYSRARGGRPVSGHAVDRTSPPIDGGGTVIIPPIYGGWGWGGWGWGGYYYDPFWGSYYYPGYYWPGYYGFYGPGYSGYSGYSGSYGPGHGAGPTASYTPEERGALRLKLKPREAEVYVDGAYAGIVDDFDGAFQKLHLPPGKHTIEVRPSQGDPVKFEVLIVRDQTVTYRGSETK
jgi:hypothetical protein